MVKSISIYLIVFRFVDQEDVLLPTMTVKETLLFSANLRLPESMTCEEKEDLVQEVMVDLRIDHIANVRIGSQGNKHITIN
jgi:ABC-type multidrug transport system ATPase subunit